MMKGEYLVCAKSVRRLLSVRGSRGISLLLVPDEAPSVLRSEESAPPTQASCIAALALHAGKSRPFPGAHPDQLFSPWPQDSPPISPARSPSARRRRSQSDQLIHRESLRAQ